MPYWDALFAFLVAMAVAAVLTPFAARLARRVGAVVMPSERGLAERPTPALGGLAILAGVLVASFFWLPATISLHHTPGTAPGAGGTVHTWTIIAGACLITLVGAIDDYPPAQAAVEAPGPGRGGADRGGGRRGRDRCDDPVHRLAPRCRTPAGC